MKYLDNGPVVDVLCQDVKPPEWLEGIKALGAALLFFAIIGFFIYLDDISTHARRVKQCSNSVKYTNVQSFWDEDIGCMWKYPDGSIKRATTVIY